MNLFILSELSIGSEPVQVPPCWNYIIVGVNVRGSRGYGEDHIYLHLLRQYTSPTPQLLHYLVLLTTTSFLPPLNHTLYLYNFPTTKNTIHDILTEFKTSRNSRFLYYPHHAYHNYLSLCTITPSLAHTSTLTTLLRFYD